MTLDEKIAALPKMPPAIPAEAAGYASAMSARLALMRETLQAMVDSCLCRSILGGDDCHPCADARKVLEATR